MITRDDVTRSAAVKKDDKRILLFILDGDSGVEGAAIEFGITENKVREIWVASAAKLRKESF